MNLPSKFLRWLTRVAAVCGAGCPVAPAAGPDNVTVFAAGAGGYHTYRIPAAVVTPEGTLLAFCEGRKSGRSDAGDIDLLLSRSLDGGKTWSAPQVVWDDGANTCGNPSPVVDRETGTVWLPMTWNLGTDHEREIMEGKSEASRQVFVTRSSDDGQTWAEPVEITGQVKRDHWRWYATGPGNAIQLARGPDKGRLLIPANHSDHSDPDQHPYRSHVFWSDDHGATWRLGGIQGDRTNESAVVERSDGSVLQAMRSYHGGNRRAMAASTDGGATWGTVYLDPTLETPVCQGSILRYSWPDDPGGDGKSRVLFSSPPRRRTIQPHRLAELRRGEVLAGRPRDLPGSCRLLESARPTRGAHRCPLRKRRVPIDRLGHVPPRLARGREGLIFDRGPAL